MKRAYRCLRVTNVAVATRTHIGLKFDANYRLGAFPAAVCALVNIDASSFLGDPHRPIK